MVISRQKENKKKEGKEGKKKKKKKKRMGIVCYVIKCRLSFSVMEWEGEMLEITRISRLDMGVYLCIATNGVPPTVSKQIRVSVDCE